MPIHLAVPNWHAYVIDDAVQSVSNCWSADKIAQEIAASGGGAVIDDATTAADKVWSSQKTNAEVNSRAPSGHTHDDRYYTESETDTLLAGKSDDGHSHDGRYYTETETDALLAGKADDGHGHSWNEVSKAGSSIVDLADVPAVVNERYLYADSSGNIQWVAGSGGGGGAPEYAVNDLGSITASTNVNYASGAYVKATLGANIQFTFSSQGTSAEMVFLEVMQDGTGGRSATFSGANIVLPGGITPVSSSTAGARDLYTFLWNGAVFLLVNFVSGL